MAKSAYKRILLKVSGEVLAGDQSFGIEPQFLHQVADQIAELYGVQAASTDFEISASLVPEPSAAPAKAMAKTASKAADKPAPARKAAAKK